MERITLQAISELYSEQYGVTKKYADMVSKTFFDKIIEGLQTDGVTKIKGLGTFKISEVAERESVNINNGERFVIPGYKKVVFTPSAEISQPAKTVRTELAATDLSSDNTETSPENNEVSSGSVKSSADNNTDIAESDNTTHDSTAEETDNIPIQEETEDLPPFPTIPVDDFEIPMHTIESIDTLIATPESIQELRDRYEEAVQKAQETFTQAEKAHREMLRLKQLIEKQEAFTSPDTNEAVSDSSEMKEEPINETAEKYTHEENANLTEKDEALINILENKNIEQDEQPKKSHALLYTMITIVVLFVCLIPAGVYYYKTEYLTNIKTQNKDVSQTPTPPVKARPIAKKQEVITDTIKSDTTEHQIHETPKTEDAPKIEGTQQAKTHKMLEGESLTKISRKYYGTKDSVRAIIRINKFENPDNVAIGTIVKLP